MRTLQDDQPQADGTVAAVRREAGGAQGKLGNELGNEERLTNLLLHLQVDVDECEDIAMEYNVSSMPTFVFVKNGNKVDEFAGANANKLDDTIKKFI